MLKVSHFFGESEHGLGAVPLFGPADAAFEKTAAPTLLPEVMQYIGTLRPRDDAQYVLVNAMGAGEFYGSNINGDHFPEAGLIHKPDGWTGNPLLDAPKGKSWTYGFPTFYNAHPFAHHRNKNPSRAFGEVELATWNPHMRRVELVTRVDKDKCLRFGGVGVWDRLRDGQYPDVSMGTKVPFDTCSICLDWDTYKKALQTFNPKRHKHPGIAALEYHKKHGPIRGLSVTRKDYCEHAMRMMNRILPDGRKVFVYNDFPRFFDISFVFIGADKTAKVMVFIHGGKIARPSVHIAEDLGYTDGPQDAGVKVASVPDEVLKQAFLGKQAKNKAGEIDKDVVPSQFAGKAVPVLTKREPDLPTGLMGSLPMKSCLSTLAGLGMILRPREFQRITLAHMGKKSLSDELDRQNVLFPKVEERDPVSLPHDSFMPSLARILLPLLAMRSALGPIIERRVVVMSGRPEPEEKSSTSLPSELLRKIGAAYNGYRDGVMELVPHAPDFISGVASPSEEDLRKLSSAPVNELFTPLSAAYLSSAFLDELPLDRG